MYPGTCTRCSRLADYPHCSPLDAARTPLVCPRMLCWIILEYINVATVNIGIVPKQIYMVNIVQTQQRCG